MTTDTIKMNFKDFDFSLIQPSKSEVRDVFETLSSMPRVQNITGSLPASEAFVTITFDTMSNKASRDSEGSQELISSVFEDLPESIDIKQVTIVDSNPLQVKIFLSLYAWFEGESCVNKAEPAYCDESIAFAAVHLPYISQVSEIHPTQLKNGKYALTIDLNEPIQTTHIFNEIQEFVGLSIGAVGITEEGIQQLVLSWSSENTYGFSVSDADAFRGSQLRHHENLALEEYETTLPCGHTGSIDLLLIGVPNEGVNDKYNIVTVDGFECREILLTDSEDTIPRLQPPTSKEKFTYPENSIRIDFKHGFVCTECNVVFSFVDTRSVRNSLLNYPRPNRESVDIGGDEYNFLVFPVEPVGIEYLESSDIDLSEAPRG